MTFFSERNSKCIFLKKLITTFQKTPFLEVDFSKLDRIRASVWNGGGKRHTFVKIAKNRNNRTLGSTSALQALRFTGSS